MTKTCPDCENYENGLCRLVYKLASDYRNTEESYGGGRQRGRFYVRWMDHSKRNFANYSARLCLAEWTGQQMTFI
jgi:hypothetical protein